MISLQSFAESRNEKADTIRKYINRHKEISEHTLIENKKMMLDEQAINMLEEIYPLPAPVQVIEDTESRRELIKMQKLVIQLQSQLNESRTLIAQAEATKMLLEDKEKQMQKLEEMLNEEKSEKKKALEQVDDATRKMEIAQKEVQSFEKTIFGLYRKRE